MVATRNQAKDKTEDYSAPGVHLEFIEPEKVVEFRTGVPVFIGFGQLTEAAAKECNGGCGRFTSWADFKRGLRISCSPSFLSYAVRGFSQMAGNLVLLYRCPRIITP